MIANKNQQQSISNRSDLGSIKHPKSKGSDCVDSVSSGLVEMLSKTSSPASTTSKQPRDKTAPERSSSSSSRLAELEEQRSILRDRRRSMHQKRIQEAREKQKERQEVLHSYNSHDGMQRNETFEDSASFSNKGQNSYNNTNMMSSSKSSEEFSVLSIDSSKRSQIDVSERRMSSTRIDHCGNIIEEAIAISAASSMASLPEKSGAAMSTPTSSKSDTPSQSGSVESETPLIKNSTKRAQQQQQQQRHVPFSPVTPMAPVASVAIPISEDGKFEQDMTEYEDSEEFEIAIRDPPKKRAFRFQKRRSSSGSIDSQHSYNPRRSMQSRGGSSIADDRSDTEYTETSWMSLEDELDLMVLPAGPVHFAHIQDRRFMRVAKRMFKKLNHDPWNEFKKYRNEDVVMILEKYPEVAKVRFKFDHFSGNLFPLSLICAMGGTVESTKLAHEAFRDAVEECDDWIGTPLHYACAHKAKSSVVRYLIACQPEMLRCLNAFNRTPLHMAALFQASTKVIQTLVEEFPGALEVHDKDGNTPLHLACENTSNMDLIETLATANPEICLSISSHKEQLTPLHMACAKGSKNMVKLLLDINPDAAMAVDAMGQTPLHVAVQQGNMTTPKTLSTIVEMLIAAYPEARSAPTKRGQTPLRLARRKKAPENVIKML